MPRLFFALDLAEKQNLAARKQIVALKAQLSEAGKPVQDNNLHLTLAFLGNVTAQHTSRLRKQANHIKAGIIETNTGELGFFNRSGAIWLGLDPVPDGLSSLARTLQSLSSSITGKDFDQEYIPHITLLRNATVPQLVPLTPLSLTFRRFGLFVSEPDPEQKGARYQCLQHWPLNEGHTGEF
ncbi:RNA 2',3'-cyclic phosphodiesterase [Veronia pacifica]|uniref:RNA 2',3'-cyclic phosphodiesterase n=1 Tax=Veronia pacifica TaxID=1080227 RepID=A0A1C3EIV4_9GAMM|nr:RNA 2',3'-cyclic phosphodiesterase [Veronia pacifica]ODA33171.1 2'-5' RNA ligase [Veronia pacifica]